jgi:hypothetical protein
VASRSKFLPPLPVNKLRPRLSKPHFAISIGLPRRLHTCPRNFVWSRSSAKPATVFVEVFHRVWGLLVSLDLHLTPRYTRHLFSRLKKKNNFLGMKKPINRLLTSTVFPFKTSTGNGSFFENEKFLRTSQIFTYPSPASQLISV